MLYRALIKTHHMTSRKKLQNLTKAAKTLSCSVVLKVGRPPGVMLAEAEKQDAVQAWVDVVKRLRYKDYRLLRLEEFGEDMGKLTLESGHVREYAEMKDLSAYLEECGIRDWWTEHMGFARGGL